MGFTAINIAVQNSFDTTNTKNPRDNKAAALKNETDKSIFYKVYFLGYQDTYDTDKISSYFSPMERLRKIVEKK